MSRLFAPLMLALVMAACTTSPQRLEPAPEINEFYDPFENQNRRALAVNKVVDDLYIKPIANFYKFIVPKPARDGAANVTSNILQPSYIFNEFLQLDFEDAGHSTVRFAVNTTVGVGGIFDVATGMGFENRPEDLGQTLGNWGVPQGPYFIAPFVGPTTARGTLGSLARLGVDPVTLAILPEDISVRAGVIGQRTFQKRIDSDTTLTDVYTRPDGYILLRSLYLQEQAAALYEDGDPYANLPDFE
ncbi:MAG: VacJ family lipoprotein [Parvularculaceae bacterium]|nr:VacJ family lipoprotein [Parvularculaceae bacterium]